MKSLVERLQEYADQYVNEKLKGSSAVNTSLIGKDIQKILEKEAETLKEYIQNGITAYYKERKPDMYKRTKGLENALYIEDFHLESNQNANGAFISIKFDKDKSYGKSMFETGQMGYKPYLINYGWQLTRDVGMGRNGAKLSEEFRKGYMKDESVEYVRIPMSKKHLGYQHGAGFVEKAIEKYNRENKYGLKVDKVDTFIAAFIDRQNSEIIETNSLTEYYKK